MRKNATQATIIAREIYEWLGEDHCDITQDDIIVHVIKLDYGMKVYLRIFVMSLIFIFIFYPVPKLFDFT